jgi:micrococcal nuclease
MFFILFFAIMVLPMGLSAPDEASGIVTNVVDGDTFDIRIDKTDSRIIYEIERVRLADVDCPEMSTSEGPLAKECTYDMLLGKTVWLDIDDKGVRGPYGRLICLVYLDPNGGISFNQIIVEAGHAEVKDYTDNEFDPDEWWSGEQAPSEPTPTVSGKFVGSKKSDKYHYPSCRWAEKISPENEIWFSSSEDARAHGYVPCGVCKPP